MDRLKQFSHSRALNEHLPKPLPPVELSESLKQLRQLKAFLGWTDDSDFFAHLRALWTFRTKTILFSK